MANANYLKGRQFEYEVMHKLKEGGYECVRASGSHGMFDIVAMKNDKTRLIQCKVGASISLGELRELVAWGRENKRSVEVWHKVPRKYVEISIVDPSMPMPLRNRISLKDF